VKYYRIFFYDCKYNSANITMDSNNRIIGTLGEGESIQLGINSTGLHTTKTNVGSDDVVAFQNLSNEGFSAIQFVDDTSIKHVSMGWGNSSSTRPSTAYLWSESPFVFLNTNDATSPTTGSVRFNGGIGVNGQSMFAGSITAPYPTADDHVATKSYVDANTSYSFTVGDGLSKIDSVVSVTSAQPTITSLGTLTGLTSSGVVSVTDSTVSNSSTTGALRVTGGVGVQGSLFLGTHLNVAGTTTLTGAVTVPAPTGTTHATTKAYVDGATYLTAGTGLTKSGSTFSVNATQSQITSLGTLTGLTSSGVVSVTDSTISNSSTTGALRVTGGVGVQGSLFLGTHLNVAGTTTLTGAVTVPTPTGTTHATTKDYVDGATYLTAGTGLTKSGSTFSVNATQNQITSLGTLTGLTSSGVVSVTDSTVSNSSTTGALRVTGGVGVQGSLFLGTHLNVAGTTTLTGAVTVPAPTGTTHATTKAYVDEATYLTAGTGLTKSGSTFSVNAAQSQITSLGTLTALNASGIVTFTNTTQSTSTTTGGLRIHGGVGIQRNLNIGGNITASNLGTLSSRDSLNYSEILDRPTLGDLAFKDAVDWETEVVNKPDFFEEKSGVVPPAPMTDHTTNLEDVWLTGEYKASASSADSGFGAWKAFDHVRGADSSSTDRWRTSSGNYSPSGYSGNITTVSNEGSHLGEWLQIEMPKPVHLKKMELYNGNSGWMPKDLTLIGSNDGATWTHMASMTLPWLTTDSVIRTIPPGGIFKFVRMVVHSIASGNSAGVTVFDLRFDVEAPPSYLGALASKDVVDWETDVVNKPSESSMVQAGTGLTLTDNTLSVNSNQSQITTVGSIDSTLRIRNTNSASHSILRILNDNAADAALSLWINGSMRSLDGGGNAASLRNNLGELRLQSQGGNGIRIAPHTGDVTVPRLVQTSVPRRFERVDIAFQDVSGHAIYEEIVSIPAFQMAKFEFFARCNGNDNQLVTWNVTIGSQTIAFWNHMIVPGSKPQSTWYTTNHPLPQGISQKNLKISANAPWQGARFTIIITEI
jgi:hypothetical protein